MALGPAAVGDLLLPLVELGDLLGELALSLALVRASLQNRCISAGGHTHNIATVR